MAYQRNRFIDDVDLSETTSLTHLLDRHDTGDDTEEVSIIKHSPFYSEKQFAEVIHSIHITQIINILTPRMELQVQ